VEVKLLDAFTLEVLHLGDGSIDGVDEGEEGHPDREELWKR
jgi:hypothetical protein